MYHGKVIFSILTSIWTRHYMLNYYRTINWWKDLIPLRLKSDGGQREIKEKCNNVIKMFWFLIYLYSAMQPLVKSCIFSLFKINSMEGDTFHGMIWCGDDHTYYVKITPTSHLPLDHTVTFGNKLYLSMITLIPKFLPHANSHL